VPTILLTHSPEERRTRFCDAAFATLQALGTVRLNETGGVLTTEQLLALGRGCDVILCDRLTPAEARLFAGLPDLVALCRGAVDVRNIDLAAASAHGVLVTHAGPAYVDAVAELTLALILDLARGVSDAVIAYRLGREPPALMGTQLAGATLGLIGCGAIGRRVAALGVAFGMRVLVDDPFVELGDAALIRTDLDGVLRAADFVVCLAVASAATDGLMNEAAFARMKPTAFFVNLSRGTLVDEAALERVLRERRIAGAALDVGTAPGQMPPLGLAALPNVIATPHIGGLTQQAVDAQALEAVGQVAAVLHGRLPHGALNAPHAIRLKALVP
jgi:D-3-phosphoglycerate dehydrogenase